MSSPAEAAPRVTRADEPDSQGASWTLEALRSVWAHQQDRVADRIETIESALTALACGSLDGDLRRDAARAAHMLAGSLGMFGFMRASEDARELELELAHPTRDRAVALIALLLDVRGEVQGPVTLWSHPSEQ